MMARMRVRLLDVALGAVTAGAVVAGTAAAGEVVSQDGTVPLAAGLGLAVLWRDRWPVGVLVGSVLLLAGFGGSGFGVPGIVWPATVAYVTVVLAGRLWWAVGVGVANLGVLGAFSDSAAMIGVETLWLVAVLAAGQASLTAKRVNEEAGRGRAAEERLVIARELHDVVAHTLSVVGVHLNVAADALDDDPDEARAALRLAQSVRGQAMTDLRSLIGVLREEPVTADLPALVERTRAAGLDVRLTGDTEGLPAPVARAVYRIVQESLTNVIRHAEAGTATVTVSREPDGVTVTVTDDGPGTRQGRGGHGIDGMRERATALGGTLHAGPRASGGFEVRARFPVRNVRG
jgi:signal transduction histidine kinase